MLHNSDYSVAAPLSAGSGSSTLLSTLQKVIHLSLDFSEKAVEIDIRAGETEDDQTSTSNQSGKSHATHEAGGRGPVHETTDQSELGVAVSRGTGGDSGHTVFDEPVSVHGQICADQRSDEAVSGCGSDGGEAHSSGIALHDAVRQVLQQVEAFVQKPREEVSVWDSIDDHGVGDHLGVVVKAAEDITGKLSHNQREDKSDGAERTDQ